MQSDEGILEFCDTIFGANIEEPLSFIEYIFQQNSIPDGGKVLDAGCGIGRLARPLAKKGYTVNGIDIDTTFIDEAIKLSSTEGNCIDYSIDNITVLSGQPSEYFDAVICMLSVFHYLKEADDAENALRAFCRILKPGGIFIIDLFNVFSVLGTFQKTRELNYKQGDYDVRHIFDHTVYPAFQRWSHKGTIIIKQAGKEVRRINEIHEIRHFNFYELQTICRFLEMEIIGSYSNYNSREILKWDSTVPEGSRMLIVGRKKG